MAADRAIVRVMAGALIRPSIPSGQASLTRRRFLTLGATRSLMQRVLMDSVRLGRTARMTMAMARVMIVLGRFDAAGRPTAMMLETMTLETMTLETMMQMERSVERRADDSPQGTRPGKQAADSNAAHGRTRQVKHSYDDGSEGSDQRPAALLVPSPRASSQTFDLLEAPPPTPVTFAANFCHCP